jgi:cytochrome c oxidase subunit 2
MHGRSNAQRFHKAALAWEGMPIRRLLRQRALAAAAIAAVALLSACAPAPATQEGARVKSLYDTFMVAAVAVFVIVAGLITWSIVRYRLRADSRQPATFHSNIPIEIVWWSLPTLLVIGLFVISAQVLGFVDARAKGDALQMQVEGSQWQWRFTYPNGVVVSGLPNQPPPEVVLPVGEAITFHLSSPDVIHSFYVPAFLIKRDTIPGVNNQVDVTIDQPGSYSGQCAEFCGLLHADMRFTIRAVPRSEFDSWLAGQQPAASPPAASPSPQGSPS